MEDFTKIANEVRRDIIKMLLEAGSGHPAGSLSMTDILVALYFGIMHHDPKNPNWKDRDRLVVSNGHTCPALYSVLARAGYFPIRSEEHTSELQSLTNLVCRLLLEKKKNEKTRARGRGRNRGEEQKRSDYEGE